MNLDWARLTVRLSRFELLAFSGFIAIFAATTVITAGWIDSLRPSADCLGIFSGVAVGPSDAPPSDCLAAMNAWQSAQGGIAGLSAGLLLFLSFAAGLFLGVPIVARELERGTSRLAWSMAPSRMRYHAARASLLLPARRAHLGSGRTLASVPDAAVRHRPPAGRWAWLHRLGGKAVQRNPCVPRISQRAHDTSVVRASGRSGHSGTARKSR